VKIPPFDYSLVQSREFTDVWSCLPKDLEARFQSLPETLGRLKAALHFKAGINSHGENGDPFLPEAYFRAALNEFSSVKYVLRGEVRRSQPGALAFDILETANPLIHAMLLLRNHQVHLKRITLDRQVISLCLKLVPGAESIDVNVWHMASLDPNKILDSRQNKNRDSRQSYTLANVERLCEWLLEAQRPFGVGDLVQQGITMLAEWIAETYLT